LIVRCPEGEIEGFFDKDVVGAFKDNTGTCPLSVRRTINIKHPLVFFQCVLQVIDEVEEALSFDGAMGFIANVELG